MSTIDEVLAAAEVVDAICVIDGETRIISVPNEYKELGVESDEKVTRVKFQCPKIVGDNIDLTEYNLYINYRNAGNKLNSYLVEDVTITGDTINFSWLLSRHVTESPGTINYIVCAKKSDDTGVINEWNTKVATGTVGVGLETTEEIEEQNIDAIEQILRSIVELENKVGSGSSGGSSIAIDETLTQSGQAADAKAVGDRLDSLSEEIVTTAASQVSVHNTGTDTHSDIRLLIQGLTDRLNALADSDDTTLDQLSEVVAYIKSNKSMIDAITTSKVSVADIVDNLTTNVSNKPLSAAQGVVIKTLIDALRNDKLDAAELTNAVNTALAQAKASGEFDGADGRPGENGTDGYSPTANVTQNDNGATITITDKNGTTTATVKNGKDGADGNPGADGIPGKDGQPGKDGVGIQSVVQTTTSTADGGDNVFTVTLTNGTSATFTVKNGRTGSTGAPGDPGADGSPGKNGTSATHSWNGTVLTITSASGTSSADLKGGKGDKGDTGAPGHTPVKGTDYFTDADKAEMVSAVIAQLPVYAGEVV